MNDIKYTFNVDANGEFVSATVDGKPAEITPEYDLPQSTPRLITMVGTDTKGNEIKLVEFEGGLRCWYICGMVICQLV